MTRDRVPCVLRLIALDLANVVFASTGAVAMAGLLCVVSVLWVAGHITAELAIAVLVGWTWLAVLARRRVKTLDRLCRVGVEVTAELATISDHTDDETDLTETSYRYEFAGTSYELTVVGRHPFFRAARRFGRRAIVLVDPADPRVALVLRSADPPRSETVMTRQAIE